ncbi:hypothetical protein Tco_1113452 [Tanacetum coccineum]|uniref:Zinc finger, CCHC-type n=1 Tax=Tanacetum coccineum TaxID=301880 RepID=A0ABQ5ISC4_9ASTR
MMRKDDHYREDSNEAAFAVAAVEKIYAHESLTFNNTVACEVIPRWKARLKDDMNARSDVYVLSNGCKKFSDDNDGYYWEYTPVKGNILGMKIVRDQSGNTLRVSQSRFYNGKLAQTLLEGYSILSLEGSLSGDCDVENNGKWSYIYVVGSQEYQMVCTRLDIASTDVGMLDKFDRGLQTDRRTGFVDSDYVMGRSITRYMTLTEAAKEAIWLKGLLIESGFKLKIVAGIAIGISVHRAKALRNCGIHKATCIMKNCASSEISSNQTCSKRKRDFACLRRNSSYDNERLHRWAIGVSSSVRKGKGDIAFSAGPNLVVWARYAFWARGHVATIAIYYLPGGRPVMENYYYTSLLSTGKKLSSLIALALNLDDHFFHSVGALDKPYAFL